MLGPASGLSSRTPTPWTVPYSQWMFHGWTMIAQCPCEHQAGVHMGAVIRAFGDQRTFATSSRLAMACKCIRCGRRSPRIVVVDKSGRIIASSDRPER